VTATSIPHAFAAAPASTTDAPAADAHRRAAAARDAALAALLSLQKPDGHWCGELQGDSILASEYLLMKFILGQENAPMRDGRPAREVLARIAAWMKSMQRDDGTWGQYPGAAMDLSATVKAYFTLKLLGEDPAAPHMTKARAAIRASGGAERCNSFTNFYLACLGQISWNAVPAIPIELIYLPRWFFFHMDKVSAWTRTMILPLAIVATLRPTRRLPKHLGIDELFIDSKKRHRLTFDHRPELAQDGIVSWTAAFRFADAALKWMHMLGGTPIRRLALKRALDWILSRAGQDGAASTAGLGAIFPPMVYIQIALRSLGYPRHHPIVQRAEKELDDFFIEAGDHIRLQPCFSPVWDTGIALYALADCGLTIADVPARAASHWLRSKQCDFRGGDWVRNLREEDCRKHADSPSLSGRGRGGGSATQLARTHTHSPALSLGEGDGANPAPHATQSTQHSLIPAYPAGWFFEYANAFYPDVDDTAMVAMALKRADGVENERAAARGVAWIFDMQNDDGGWAAFDRTRDRPILEKIPFADHNAMQDPSCPDITGRVLEMLAWHGFTNHDPRIARAIDYIKSKQEPEGCWFGRWGVNYIYGTWQAVIGPIRCGISGGEPWVQRAGAWIKSIQKDDGSFGESADSYENPALKGRGPSTASQTAWAAMILLEIFGHADPDLKRAIDWLIDTQMTPEQASDPSYNVDGDPAGGWRELEFTGTGFPRVFYLRYHLYRLYFPLMALARHAKMSGR
jgi:squalene-hopene/tetraprenyl-beta-curcumene cyclase